MSCATVLNEGLRSSFGLVIECQISIIVCIADLCFIFYLAGSSHVGSTTYSQSVSTDLVFISCSSVYREGT